MKNPSELNTEKCQYCGYAIGLMWYDPCCQEQVDLYQQQKAQYKKFWTDLTTQYNTSLGIDTSPKQINHFY